MADATVERGRGAIESILSRAKRREELDGYIGKPNGSGGHTVAVPHHPGYSYIRGNTGIEGWIAEAVNIGALPDPAVQVEIAKKNGRLIVRSPDGASAATVLGVNAPAAGTPPGVQSVNTGTAQVVKSQLVEGGRLTTIGADKAYLTGLKARITPYIHSGGAWDGATLITLTPTATSGMHSYVMVGINTKTNAITQVLTANKSLAMPLLQSDLYSVMKLYPDVDWRGAVDLANGATSIDEGKLVDVRNFGAWRPKGNFTATAAPGVGDDADDGYAVGSMWIDVTGDVVYICVDATVGAAVWSSAGGSFSGDAFDVPYTPTTGGDWSSTPADVGAALDTLAADLATVTAGGALNHTYVGYNTAGGSSTSMVGAQAYMKKITLATAGWLGSIGVYVDHTAATNVQSLAAWVMSDNAGTPNLVIGMGPNWNSQSFFINTTARWIDLAMGVYLAAGDYWLVVQRPVDSGSDIRIYYDGSGSDKTQAIGGAWNADGSLYTISSTTNKYSIRGSILT